MPDTLSSPQAPDAFAWPVRVYIEDTDAGGIVFYANYLRFMERARTELLRHLGFPRIETIDESVMFVVHRLSLAYRQPAELDDELTVTAIPERIGNTYMLFRQTVSRGRVILVEAEVQVACIHRETRKPTRLPPLMRQRLESVSSQGE